MRIHNHDVADDVITAVMAAMKGDFTAGELNKVAMDAGAPEMVYVVMFGRHEHFAHRVVDRLLQKERKAGRIKFSKNKQLWKLVDQSKKGTVECPKS